MKFYNKTIIILIILLILATSRSNMSGKFESQYTSCETDNFSTTLPHNSFVCNNLSSNVTSVAHNSLGWHINQSANIFMRFAENQELGVTCLGISNNTVVLVESAYKSYFTDGERDAQVIADDFQSRVYLPTKQLLGVPREAFDGSHDVAIVITEINDRYEYWVKGFYDDSSVSENGYACLYIDRDYVSLDQYYYYHLVAHEFQHVVHSNYRGSSFKHELWFNEGMSQIWPGVLAEELTNTSWEIPLAGSNESGYIYAQSPLLYWDADDVHNIRHRNYQNAFVFNWYLYEQFGVEILKKVVQDTDTKVIASLENSLEDFNINKTFDEIFLDWNFALTLNNVTLAPQYGYNHVNMENPERNSLDTPNEDDLPYKVDDGAVFDRSCVNYVLNLNNPKFNGLGVTFDGEDNIHFSVHLILYTNTKITTIHEIELDKRTNKASVKIPLTTNVSKALLLISNLNGDKGIVMTDSYTPQLELIQGSFEFKFKAVTISNGIPSFILISCSMGMVTLVFMQRKFRQ